MKDDIQRTALRLPRELHTSIVESAKASSRTMNAEIVSRLEVSLLAEHPTTTLMSAKDALVLSNDSILTSKARLLELTAKEINDAVSAGKIECEVRLPYQCPHYKSSDGSGIDTDDPKYKDVILPVTDELIRLGYVAHFKSEFTILIIQWGEEETKSMFSCPI
jgi:hypothetical protein